MPGYLYKGFCYASTNDIANIIKSDPYINLGQSNGLTKFISYTNTGPNWVNAVTGTRAYGGSSNTTTLIDQLTFFPPSCDSVGKYMPGSGFDSLDNLFSAYFLFDMSVFETIITSSLVLFAAGVGVRYVVKMMNITIDYK